MVMGNALQESKGAKGAKLQSIRKLFEPDAACEDPARRATLLPSAGASAWQRKQKRTDMLIEIAPFAPEKSGSGHCRSGVRHTLGERKALLMALLSKVFLRYF